MEEPRLLKEIIEFHREQLRYNLSELSQLVALSESETAKVFGINLEPNDSNPRLKVLP